MFSLSFNNQLSFSLLKFRLPKSLVSIWYCFFFQSLVTISIMSLDSHDFSNLWGLRYPIREDNYRPVAGQPLIVNFTSTCFFFSPLIFTRWSINEEVNRISELLVESLRIFYGIPRSISLERTGENDKPSHINTLISHHKLLLLFSTTRNFFNSFPAQRIYLTFLPPKI